MGLGLPLKGVHKKPVAQKLLEVTPSFADRQVAMMIADHCMELGDTPYRFSINHDVRPPGNLACPLRYDWTKKDSVGIETNDPLSARRWLTSALLRGYTISRVNGALYSASIEQVRRRAAEHQRPKGNDDEDIPF
jgi:hypothetical protein